MKHQHPNSFTNKKPSKHVKKKDLVSQKVGNHDYPKKLQVKACELFVIKKTPNFKILQNVWACINYATNKILITQNPTNKHQNHLLISKVVLIIPLYLKIVTKWWLWGSIKLDLSFSLEIWRVCSSEKVESPGYWFNRFDHRVNPDFY